MARRRDRRGPCARQAADPGRRDRTYLRTLLDGIAPVPPIDPAVRREVRAASVEANRAELIELDPEAAARLNPADTTRIARALEVVLSTGETLGEWQHHRARRDRRGDRRCARWSCCRRATGSTRAATSALRRWSSDGAVDEVEALLTRNLDPKLPVMRAIGVREIAAYLSWRDRPRGGDRRRPAGDPQLRQAAIYLVRAPAAARMAALHRPARYRASALALLGARAPSARRMDLLRDADIDPSPLAGKRVAIVGFGNQGRAQALNLNDSGVDVVVGLARRIGERHRGRRSRARSRAGRGRGGVGGRRHAARPRRDARRPLPRDRAAFRARRRARIQPRARDPLQPDRRRAATSTCSWSRPRARAPRSAPSTGTARG